MRRSGINIFGRLIVLIKPLLHIMLIAVLMGVCGFLCSTLIPVCGGYALLNAAGLSEGFSLPLIFVCVLIFAVLRGIFRYAEQTSNHYIAFKLLALIRDKVFRALRRLCPAKLDGQEKGNLISILTSDIELLEVFYAHTISPIAIAVITSLVMILFIGSFHPVFGLVICAGYLTVGLVIPLCMSKAGKDIGVQYRQEFGGLNSYFLDSLHGLSESIQFSCGEKRLEEINRRTDELDARQKKLTSYEGLTKAVTDTAILLFSLLMLIICLHFHRMGLIAFDGVLIPVIAAMSSFGPVVALSSLSNNLSLTLASGDRVLNLLDEEPVVTENIEGRDVPFTGASCEDITFGYDDLDILKDFNINIPQSQIIGISGRNGSGKSTLLKLLMRFWDTDYGTVRISDSDIRQINTGCLRKLEGYVTQETWIFHDTIENNIKIGNLNATHEQVVAAAKKASLHDFVASLPQGYATNVGELGSGLSGGERQRIGIARAFLHDAPFILLDEPTSNLDSLNEGIILKSLIEQGQSKTILLVSHRKSTMKIADKMCHIASPGARHLVNIGKRTGVSVVPG